MATTIAEPTDENEIQRVQDKIKQLKSGQRKNKYIGLNN